MPLSCVLGEDMISLSFVLGDLVPLSCILGGDLVLRGGTSSPALCIKRHTWDLIFCVLRGTWVLCPVYKEKSILCPKIYCRFSMLCIEICVDPPCSVYKESSIYGLGFGCILNIRRCADPVVCRWRQAFHVLHFNVIEFTAVPESCVLGEHPMS